MYKYSDVESILKKISDENPLEMEKIDEIDESVFARIEAKVLEKLSKVKKQKKMKPRIYLRAAAAVFGIIAVFSIAFYLIDLPATRASKEAVNDIYDEIPQGLLDEADAHVGSPEYIPEGYVSDTDYVSGGEYLAEYKYVNPADESLFILITIDRQPIEFPDGGQIIEASEYNGQPFIFLTVPGSPDINYANFSDTHGHGVQIASTLDYDTVMKIMVSME